MEREGGGGERWGPAVITPGGDSRYWEEDDGVDARDEVRPDELEVQILDHKPGRPLRPKNACPNTQPSHFAWYTFFVPCLVYVALSFRVVRLFCTMSCVWTRACGRTCLSSELEKNFSGKKLFNDFSSCHSLLTHACVRACVCVAGGRFARHRCVRRGAEGDLEANRRSQEV